MIRKLETRIIVVVLGTLLIVFAAVLLVLNLSVCQNSVKRAEVFMESVVENDGFLFPPRNPDVRRGGGRDPLESPEMMRAGRFFYAKVDQSGEILELDLQMMFDFSKDDAGSYISATLASGKVKGNIDNYRFISEEKPYGRIIVFAERSIEMGMLSQLNTTSLWTAGIVCLILACLAVFYAKWTVRPIKTAFDRQRRFISDASHELKTPLTVIITNVDIMKNETGGNQRLDSIKEQAERMSGLVHDLLTLAKTEERLENKAKDEFSLSNMILNTALEFESRAFGEGKQYSYDIAESISYTGDMKQTRQLVSILIDNAFHYSDEKGQIKVSLSMEGSRIRISVFNTGIGVPDDEMDKIFERFYRIDESRNRETGGYGMGLSIAKAIAETQKHNISVSGKYGKWIQFDVMV